MPPRKMISFGFFLIIAGVLIWYAGNFLNNQTLNLVGVLVSLSGVRPLVPRLQNDETYSRELKSEERRAIILLGFLGAFIAFDFWLRGNDPKANPGFNFICDYPCPHVTFYWIPFLDRLISLWFLWAGSMIVYFSEDMFHGWKLNREFKQVFRGLGHGFLILWPLLFAWTVIFSEGDFLIEKSVPQSVLAVYWLFAVGVLGGLIAWLVGTVTGLQGSVKQLAKAEIEGFQVLVDYFRGGLVGLISLIERFARRFLKGRISPRQKRLWFKGKCLLLLPPKVPRRKRPIDWRFWRSKSNAPWIPQHPI